MGGGVGFPPAVVDVVTPSSVCAWAQIADATSRAIASHLLIADSPTRSEPPSFRLPRLER